MALLDDVKATLITGSIGVSDTSSADEWAIHLGHMPDSQDQSIAILELPGDQPESNWKLDFPAFHIVVRGKPYEYDVARTKIQAIFDLIHNEDTVFPSGYINVLGATSGPISLGQDENKRPLLAWVFNVIKDR